MPRKQIKLSVNSEEYKELAAAAKKQKLPISTYIKSRLLAAEAGSRTRSTDGAGSKAADSDLIFLSDLLETEPKAQRSGATSKGGPREASAESLSALESAEAAINAQASAQMAAQAAADAADAAELAGEVISVAEEGMEASVNNVGNLNSLPILPITMDSNPDMTSIEPGKSRQPVSITINFN